MLSVTDLFCGAGGSSTGAEAVPGVRVRMASNHNELAIECHNLNLPHVDHDIADISGIDPRRYPTTDILWASPACTFWSQARGEKQDFAEQPVPDPTLFDPADTADADDEPPLPDSLRERSRALMQDVPRFAEYHRYKAVIVENTLPLLKWRHFSRWVARMRALGYEHRVLTLNSAFAHQLGAPAPQLRDRVYVVFWQSRYAAPDFERWTRPRAWCPSCERVVTALPVVKNPRRPYGAYWQQYLYRCPTVACRYAITHPYTLPALAAIDLANPGQRIGDRARPLEPKTMARISAGVARELAPTVLDVGGNTFERRPGVRAWSAAQPLRTLHTTASKAIAVPPLLVPVEGRDGKTARTAWQPGRAQTGRSETALLVPAGGTWNTQASSVAAPMRTRTTRDTEALVSVPVMIPLRNNNRAKAVAEPLDTVAANGNHHGLALLLRNNGEGAAAPGWQCTPVGEPMRTLTTSGHQSLVWQPDVLFAYDTGAFRALHRPLPTQTTIEGDALLQLAAVVEDCHFRMLGSEEVKLGMAFHHRFQLIGSQRAHRQSAGPGPAVRQRRHPTGSPRPHRGRGRGHHRRRPHRQRRRVQCGGCVVSAGTGIEWTDATWNPVTGCTKVSPGCEHCYAETFAERFRGVGGHHFERGFDLVLRPARLEQPLRWKQARRIFVNSMSDLFHPDVPDDYIARVFAVMAAAPLHTFQVLTKRHGRAHSLLGDPGFEDLIREEWDELIEAGTPGAAPCPGWGRYPLRNVWLGVSAEDQRWAEIRIPALLDTPAAVRFISAEPLLGAVTLRPEWLHDRLCPMRGGGPVCACCPGDARLDWVIAGGESGPRARPMDPAWPRGLRDQCAGAGVAFFFKQWGEHRPPLSSEDPRMIRVGKKHAGRVLDGRTWDEFPDGAR